MELAYVDTSCVVAIVLGEHGAAAVERRLLAHRELVSSNLLEAELRAAVARERRRAAEIPAGLMSWIIPERPLSDEIARVLEAGHVRGAACWHLACALYLTPEPKAISFLTLDERQQTVARALGFQL